MKKIVSIGIAVILSGSFFFASCSKTEEPAPTTSVNNSNFSGNWNNSETSVLNGANTYPLSIEQTNSTTISFAYLYGFSTKINATVSGNNFTIPTQTIEGTNVSGSGILANANQINMNYYVNNGLYIDSVTATLTK